MGRWPRSSLLSQGTQLVPPLHAWAAQVEVENIESFLPLPANVLKGQGLKMPPYPPFFSQSDVRALEKA